MLHGVVKRSDDVGEVARAIRGEGLEGKNLGLGRNQVDEPGSHGAVAKGDVGRAVQDRSCGLIQNGGSGLLDVSRLLTLSVAVAILHAGHIEPLGGAGLVPREIVTPQKNGIEDRVIRVYARINDGDDSATSYGKTVMGVRKADDLGSGLGRVTVPDGRAVIVDWRRVIEARRNVWQWRLWRGDNLVGLNADDP